VGASPPFPPHEPDAAAARERLLDLIRREPRQFGIERVRWRLSDVLGQLDGWHLHACSSLSRLVRRLHVSFQQGRSHVHSPDLNYAPKRREVQACQLAAQLAAQEAGWQGATPPVVPPPVVPPVDARPVDARRQVTLLLDELTFYRQPSLARAYAPMSHDALTGHAQQPCAELAVYQPNTETRIAATLDVVSGQVCARQASRIGVRELVGLYQEVRAAYPHAERIYVLQDNWPVHWHADLLVALEPQETRYPPRRPPSWPVVPSPQALRAWADLHLPIQLVFLPTYASWLNPIEKLWRYLKQTVLHLHRLANDLALLRAQVLAFLARFTQGSADALTLLRYVGLLPI
jgi:transposase